MSSRSRLPSPGCSAAFWSSPISNPNPPCSLQSPNSTSEPMCAGMSSASGSEQVPLEYTHEYNSAAARKAFSMFSAGITNIIDTYKWYAHCGEESANTYRYGAGDAIIRERCTTKIAASRATWLLESVLADGNAFPKSSSPPTLADNPAKTVSMAFDTTVGNSFRFRTCIINLMHLNNRELLCRAWVPAPLAACKFCAKVSSNCTASRSLFNSLCRPASPCARSASAAIAGAQARILTLRRLMASKSISRPCSMGKTAFAICWSPSTCVAHRPYQQQALERQRYSFLNRVCHKI